MWEEQNGREKEIGMNSLLTAARKSGAAAVIALVVLAGAARTARADYLVRTYADSAPAYLRSTVQSPMPARREPLTVYRPHTDCTTAPPDPELDKASLAAALQALLVCAIPPPTDTIIQTPTTTTPPTDHPTVPPPPQFIWPSFPPETPPPPTGSGVANVPEPASLVTALVGGGLAGLALWRRRGKLKSSRRLAA
jgi:hypothetical protein